jgi:hypothetical protein
MIKEGQEIQIRRMSVVMRITTGFEELYLTSQELETA